MLSYTHLEKGPDCKFREFPTRFGTRLHFELIVITKVDTINDNVVSTGRTLSKQSPCAIYSVSAAWIVRQEIEVTPLSPVETYSMDTSDFLWTISYILLCFNKTPMDNLFNIDSFTLLLWFEIDSSCY